MSAQLAGDTGNSFHARLALAAGVSVAINAPSMQALSSVVALLQPAANETPGKPAATAPAGASVSPTAAPSAQPVAAPVAGEAGNAAAVSQQPATAAASSASSSAGSTSLVAAAVTFDELKKAFLLLAEKRGREKCVGVLALFKLGKLPDAAPEQYPAVLAAIQKASA